MLQTCSKPIGIHVTLDWYIYVADSRRSRVQLHRFGDTHATTVVINNPIVLNRPSAVTLDAGENLFIADHGNHRILEADRHSFRCIVGCSGSTGGGLHQLSYPRSFAFDSEGNMFVADTRNNSTLMFKLVNRRLCGDCQLTNDRNENRNEFFCCSFRQYHRNNSNNHY